MPELNPEMDRLEERIAMRDNELQKQANQIAECRGVLHAVLRTLGIPEGVEITIYVEALRRRVDELELLRSAVEQLFMAAGRPRHAIQDNIIAVLARVNERPLPTNAFDPGRSS